MVTTIYTFHWKNKCKNRSSDVNLLGEEQFLILKREESRILLICERKPRTIAVPTLCSF